jgi:hypothetical protein
VEWSVDCRLRINAGVLALSAKPALKSSADCEPARAEAGSPGESWKTPPRRETVAAIAATVTAPRSRVRVTS